MNDAQVGAWDALADAYARRRDLDPPERELLARLRRRLAALDVLDLGVGAGRTAYTLAALVRSYVGVDVSTAMIARARTLVPEDERVRFAVADARDLSAFRAESFDLVLFSFNGIDSVSHDGRLRILHEVRRVTRPGGTFAFSCHSLDALPLDARLPSPSWPPGAWLRGVRRAVGRRAVNRRLDLEAVRRRGWAVVRDGAHDFGVVLYYVARAEQERQLAAASFVVEAVLGPNGLEVGEDASAHAPHLFWIVRAGGGR